MTNPFYPKSRIAKLYYWFFGVPTLNMHLRWRAIKKFIKNTASPVLDIGCGNGAFSMEIAKRSCTFVVGLDINRKDVSFAKKVARTRKINNVDFLIADAKKLPLRTGVFKAAICLEVLEHIQEDYMVLSESSRVLEKDGQLIITSVLPSYTLYSFLPIFCSNLNYANFFLEMDHLRDGYTIYNLEQKLIFNGFKLLTYKEFVKFFGSIGVKYLDFLLHYRAALGPLSEYVKMLLHPIFLILTKIDELLPSSGKELVALAVKT